MPIRLYPQAGSWRDVERRLLGFGAEGAGPAIETEDKPDDAAERGPELTEAGVRPAVEARLADARRATATLRTIPGGGAASDALRTDLRTTAPPVAPVLPPGIPAGPLAAPEGEPKTQGEKFDQEIKKAMDTLNNLEIKPDGKPVVSGGERLAALVSLVGAIIGKAKGALNNTLNQPLNAPPPAPGPGGPGRPGAAPGTRPRWNGGRGTSGGPAEAGRRELPGGAARLVSGDAPGRRPLRDTGDDTASDSAPRPGGPDRASDGVEFDRDDPKAIDDVDDALAQERAKFADRSGELGGLQGQRRDARAQLTELQRTRDAGGAPDPDALEDQMAELRGKIADLTDAIRPLQTEVRLINAYGRALTAENGRRDTLLTAAAPADGKPALRRTGATVNAEYPAGTDMAALVEAVRAKNMAGEIAVTGTSLTINVPAAFWTEPTVKAFVNGLKAVGTGDTALRSVAADAPPPRPAGAPVPGPDAAPGPAPAAAPEPAPAAPPAGPTEADLRGRADALFANPPETETDVSALLTETSALLGQEFARQTDAVSAGRRDAIGNLVRAKVTFGFKFDDTSKDFNAEEVAVIGGEPALKQLIAARGSPDGGAVSAAQGAIRDASRAIAVADTTLRLLGEQRATLTAVDAPPAGTDPAAAGELIRASFNGKVEAIGSLIAATRTAETARLDALDREDQSMDRLAAETGAAMNEMVSSTETVMEARYRGLMSNAVRAKVEWNMDLTPEEEAFRTPDMVANRPMNRFERALARTFTDARNVAMSTAEQELASAANIQALLGQMRGEKPGLLQVPPRGTMRPPQYSEALKAKASATANRMREFRAAASSPNYADIGRQLDVVLQQSDRLVDAVNVVQEGTVLLAREIGRGIAGLLGAASAGLVARMGLATGNNIGEIISNGSLEGAPALDRYNSAIEQTAKDILGDVIGGRINAVAAPVVMRGIRIMPASVRAKIAPIVARGLDVAIGETAGEPLAEETIAAGRQVVDALNS